MLTRTSNRAVQVSVRIFSFSMMVGLIINLKAFSTLSQWETDQPIDRSYEMQSPEEYLTSSVEPGLSERAIPLASTNESVDSYLPLFQLSKFQDMQAMYSERDPFVGDGTLFRPVTMNQAPIGLHPRVYRKGLIEFYPWFGVAQSWESNVNLTSSLSLIHI